MTVDTLLVDGLLVRELGSPAWTNKRILGAPLVIWFRRSPKGAPPNVLVNLWVQLDVVRLFLNS